MSAFTVGDSLADLIAANPGVVKPGMSIAEVKRALLHASNDVDARKVSPAQALQQMAEGERVWSGGVPNYVPATTLEEADRLADAMAQYGNYPSGMDPCFAAGLNGDAADGCPFDGQLFCTCGGAA